MKVDPNDVVGTSAECVLCADGSVKLPDGQTIDRRTLDGDSNAYLDFCRRWDPNSTFLIAYVPNDADREVFFRARDIAREVGIHMQAPIDTAERLWEMWRHYVRAWETRSAETAGSCEADASAVSLSAQAAAAGARAPGEARA